VRAAAFFFFFVFSDEAVVLGVRWVARCPEETGAARCPCAPVVCPAFLGRPKGGRSESVSLVSEFSIFEDAIRTESVNESDSALSKFAFSSASRARSFSWETHSWFAMAAALVVAPRGFAVTLAYDGVGAGSDWFG
jgi:hypothetical protein